MRQWIRLIVFLLIGVAMLPAAAYAQASLTGVVRDTSGAVLPGVTVEAASPALIEKTRAVVTDGTGQYRIVDLRPGTYTLTFTLAGFNTIRRDGIELTGGDGLRSVWHGENGHEDHAEQVCTRRDRFACHQSGGFPRQHDDPVAARSSRKDPVA